MLLAIIAVLAAIAVVGDRLAAQYATEQLRTELVSQLDDNGVGYATTDVSIGGFPFLDQVARGRYESITIDMTEVRLPNGTGGTAGLPTLHAVATGVDADTGEVIQGRARIVADRVDGTALITFATLETLVDYRQFNLSAIKITESDGALKLTGTATIAGVGIPITAIADISALNGQFQVRLRDATATGIPAPAEVRSFLNGLADRTLAARMPALPFGLRLDQVSVDPSGLIIGAAGQEVVLVP
jgi:LmeA-like phospholipid-binding